METEASFDPSETLARVQAALAFAGMAAPRNANMSQHAARTTLSPPYLITTDTHSMEDITIGDSEGDSEGESERSSPSTDSKTAGEKTRLYRGSNGLRDHPSTISTMNASSTKMRTGIHDAQQPRHVIADSETSSNSDLSSLGASPEPPTAQLRLIERRQYGAEVQCRHTTWCDCPMHASYASGKRYPHLSNWALSTMQLPYSTDRSTRSGSIETNPKFQGQADQDRLQRVKNANAWSEWVMITLPIIQWQEEIDVLQRAAKRLVYEININFDPLAKSSLAVREAPVIEKVGHALGQWKRDLDFSKLDETFARVVTGRKDLIFLFQIFLPRRYRVVSVEEAQACRGYPGESGELVEFRKLVEQLEDDRLTLMS